MSPRQRRAWRLLVVFPLDYVRWQVRQTMSLFTVGTEQYPERRFSFLAGLRAQERSCSRRAVLPFHRRHIAPFIRKGSETASIPRRHSGRRGHVCDLGWCPALEGVRVKRILLSALVSASITGSLFCVNQMATAHACNPWEQNCVAVDPHGVPGCPGCAPWEWGGYYAPGWYGGRYWGGGPWYGW